jgi:hypothetical protein
MRHETTRRNNDFKSKISSLRTMLPIENAKPKIIGNRRTIYMRNKLLPCFED